jgi:diguanylate cyclase (GGDEF)-like protein/PAS domain S-box-containing protein
MPEREKYGRITDQELSDLRQRIGKLEDQLAERDTRRRMWDTLMDNTPDLVYFKDANHGLIRASRSYAEAVGVESDRELIGKTALDLWPQEGQEIIDDERRVLAGEPMIRKEREVTRADGERRWFLLTKIPIDQNGEIIGFFAMDKDITERKLAEQALSESESRFRRIYESNMIGIAYWDKNGRITDANQAYLDMIGYSREEILSGDVQWKNITPEKYRHRDQQAMEEISQQGMCTPYEKEYIRKDGSCIPILLGGASLEGNNHVGITFAIDISEKQRAERELKQSEEKLRNIVEFSTNLFYMHNPDNILTYISPQSEHFLQCDPTEAKVRWTEFISDHPVNKQGLASTQKAIRTGQRQPPFELELIGKEGKKIWAEVNEAPLVADGRTTAIVGSLTDITDRKEALRQNEERRMYLESVLKAAPDAIVTLDAEQRIVEWNPGAVDLFGYTVEEAVGQFLDDLITSDDVLEEAKSYTNRVQRGTEIPPTEVVRYRKDGGRVEVIMAGSPILIGNTLIGAVGVYTDISDRVRMEEALRAMALRDDLTGLYNRRGFSILAEQQIKFANREKRRLYLLYADVNNMKYINDTFGHPEGDTALRETSRALETTFRKSDVIARIGGDEFVVLAIETSLSSPSTLSNRLKEELQYYNQEQSRAYQLSLSVGWVCYDPRSPKPLEELLEEADQAMYDQKKNTPGQE